MCQGVYEVEKRVATEFPDVYANAKDGLISTVVAIGEGLHNTDVFLTTHLDEFYTIPKSRVQYVTGGLHHIGESLRNDPNTPPIIADAFSLGKLYGEGAAIGKTIGVAAKVTSKAATMTTGVGMNILKKVHTGAGNIVKRMDIALGDTAVDLHIAHKLVTVNKHVRTAVNDIKPQYTLNNLKMAAPPTSAVTVGNVLKAVITPQIPLIANDFKYILQDHPIFLKPYQPGPTIIPAAENPFKINAIKPNYDDLKIISTGEQVKTLYKEFNHPLINIGNHHKIKIMREIIPEEIDVINNGKVTITMKAKDHTRVIGEDHVLKDIIVPAEDGAKGQLDRKFKHADVFGVTENNNAVGQIQFAEKIVEHIQNKDTMIIIGKYRNHNVIHYFNPETRLVVILNTDGSFLSGWEIKRKETIDTFIKTGKLGGN